MARRVDQDVLMATVAKPDLRRVDRDALVALGLQAVHQERPFEGHAPAPAHFLDGLELAFGQLARVVEQPAHQG